MRMQQSSPAFPVKSLPTLAIPCFRSVVEIIGIGAPWVGKGGLVRTYQITVPVVVSYDVAQVLKAFQRTWGDIPERQADRKTPCLQVFGQVLLEKAE